MRSFLQGTTYFFSAIAGLLLLVTIMGDMSAPQQAAGAAMAVALAVIPYVISSTYQRSRILDGSNADESKAHKPAATIRHLDSTD